jgi:hypothetical protein
MISKAQVMAIVAGDAWLGNRRHHHPIDSGREGLGTAISICLNNLNVLKNHLMSDSCEYESLRFLFYRILLI